MTDKKEKRVNTYVRIIYIHINQINKAGYIQLCNIRYIIPAATAR